MTALKLQYLLDRVPTSDLLNLLNDERVRIFTHPIIFQHELACLTVNSCWTPVCLII
ncbi:hypothetical protein ABEW32_18040 [Paenibacillus jamilae]|uniref:hypothetical protein n=1 Tax=Paenibacillus jamilae TaxID=114136 RepID=UPI003D2DB5D1